MKEWFKAAISPVFPHTQSRLRAKIPRKKKGQQIALLSF